MLDAGNWELGACEETLTEAASSRYHPTLGVYRFRAVPLAGRWSSVCR